MARKKVDMTMIAGLVEGTQEQEAPKGFQASTDPNFPVFKTPVNEDILVYIPRVGVRQTENGEVHDVLRSLLHDYREGNNYGSMRCVHGLDGNAHAVYQALGYDGTCPACEASKESWDLYRLKIEAAAKVAGVDPQNDPNNVLKTAKENALKEMAVRNAEEYVTFPVVVIPCSAKNQPAPDALDRLQVFFVHWRKQRYDENFLSTLDVLVNNPGHAAGQFFQWKFTYDSKGKQHTARDSAKNAKYLLIQDNAVREAWQSIAAKGDELASAFTVQKAAEVVVAVQFSYKDDMETDVNKLMRSTRAAIDVANTGAAALPQGTATPQIAGGTAGANPLASFTAQENFGAQAPAGGATPQG